jgi:hypothetical protein
VFGCDHFRKNERSAPSCKSEVTRGIAFSLVAAIGSVKGLHQEFNGFKCKNFSQFGACGARECGRTVAMMLVMRTTDPVFSNLFARRRRMQSAIAFILLSAGCLAAQSKKPSAPPTKSSLGSAIDRTLAEGNEAILPPHVSNLLGISPKEHEIPVKQFVEMGEPIRGFEVSTAEHNNVVIFVESRTQKKSTFYLTSRRGILRKVLSIIEGVGYSRVPTKDDKDEFEKEKKRWTDQLATQHS